jgi:hypothetical protein
LQNYLSVFEVGFEAAFVKGKKARERERKRERER